MSQSALQILVVGSDPLSGALSSAMQSDGVKSSFAFNAEEALRLLHDWRADLILLGAGQTDLLAALKGDPLSQTIPIIAFAAEGNMQEKLRAFDLGAGDCMNKPVDAAELRARIHAQVQIKRRF